MNLPIAAAGLLARLLPRRFVRPLGRLVGGERGAGRLEAISSAGFDPVRFCGQLTLEGWDHLEEAERGGRGVVAVFPPVGLMEIAPWPLGIYGGPLHLWGDALSGFLPRRARERYRLERVKDGADARRLLAAGGRVGVGWGLADERLRVVELAFAAGVPLLPVVCTSEPRGCWRVVIGAAVSPRADEPPGALEARVAAEIRGTADL